MRLQVDCVTRNAPVRCSSNFLIDDDSHRAVREVAGSFWTSYQNVGARQENLLVVDTGKARVIPSCRIFRLSIVDVDHH